MSENNLNAKEDLVVKCKLLSSTAHLPFHGTSGSAGYDLIASQSYTVKPNDCVKVDIGVAVEFPAGLHGRIIDRSSIALNKKLHVVGSLIDGDYIGRIFVVLANFGTKESQINQGERIAQLVFERYARISQFKEVDDLSSHSERGEHGFGSTNASSLGH